MAPPPARRDRRERDGFGRVVRRAGKYRRIVGDAELDQQLEHGVGDRVARRAKPRRREPHGALDGACPFVDLATNLGATEAREIVAMVERVIGDLVPRAARLEQLRGRRGPGQIGANREERDGQNRAPGEVAQPLERDVVHGVTRGPLGRGEPVKLEVERDLVEVDVLICAGAAGSLLAGAWRDDAPELGRPGKGRRRTRAAHRPRAQVDEVELRR